MEWQKAELIVKEKVAEDFKYFEFELENPVNVIGGQHFDIKLTADNGYQAVRSYSIVNPTGIYKKLGFGIEIIEEGEVSGFLDQAELGIEVEILGPIGRHFILNESVDQHIFIGGGSGVVPLISMLNSLKSDNYQFFSSFRTVARIPWFQKYLQSSSSFHYYITREKKLNTVLFGDSTIEKRRMTGEDILKPVNLSEENSFYICGSNDFVEAVTSQLLELKVNMGDIKTERFG